MSTITSSAALAVPVRGYAQAVRAHLADLGPDVVEDLTDGLEADLTEALLDDAAAAPAVLVGAAPGSTRPLDVTARFGPTAEYATELRQAAGLPEATSSAPGRFGQASAAVAQAWSGAGARWRDLWRPLTSHRSWGAAAGFARSLAPAWWILRGWVAAQAVLWSVGLHDIVLWPESTLSRVLVVVAVVVSVQWGRGAWLPRWSWFPAVVTAASVAAGLLAIPMVVDIESDSTQNVAGGSGYDAGWIDGYGSAQTSMVSDDGSPSTDGIWVDGMQVSNLFAYDAAGDPLRDVQLFDDRGRAVRTISSTMTWDIWSVPEVSGSWSFQPAVSTDGRTRWNVFPLDAVPADQVGEDSLGDSAGTDTYPHPPTGVQPTDMPWPFLKAPTTIDGAAPAEPGGGSDVETEESDAPVSDGPGENAPSGDRGGSDRTVQPNDRSTSGGGAQGSTIEATD